MDHKLEAMVAATAMDLALHSVEVNPSMHTWNEVVVPRAGMIRRWIRAQAYMDQMEVTSLDSAEREFVDVVKHEHEVGRGCTPACSPRAAFPQ